MFPFDKKRDPRLKRGFQEVFFYFPETSKKGDCRTQNGDLGRGVVSKRPIPGRISKRGFENGDLAASIRRALRRALSHSQKNIRSQLVAVISTPDLRKLFRDRDSEIFFAVIWSDPGCIKCGF